MIKSLLLFITALFALTLFTLPASAQTNKAPTAFPTTAPLPNTNPQEEAPLPDYVPNQIIVKYREDLSPHLLLFKADERKEKQKTFIGKIGLFFENLNLRLKGEKAPEVHLNSIQQLDEKIGAIEKEHLFKATAQENLNVYLIQLDGTMSVEQAIKTYEQLPEVEYVETNKIAYPTNIY